jgi:hypothetical protein
MSRFIAWSSVAAVVLVAAVAGWVSYLHAWEVIRAHGEPGMVGRLYPATVDGLIYMSSMVLLDAARRRQRAPAIARWLLAAGIAATLFANVVAGLGHGPLGAAIASWPALALVGSYELLMALIRARSSEAPGATERAAKHAAGPAVPEAAQSALEAARSALEASIRGGNPLSQRQLLARFGISRQDESAMRAEVLGKPGMANGHQELAEVTG